MHVRPNIRHHIAVIFATVFLTLAGVWGFDAHDRAREAAEPELINTSLDGVRVYRVYTRARGYVHMAVGADRVMVELK